MPADVGNQEVTLKFFDAATSSQVNARFKDVRPIGIYEGGRLNVVDGTHVSVSPLVCEIADDVHQVKIETTTLVSLYIAEATPYVILRWVYTGSAGDYMLLLVTATPLTNDLIVGKCSFGAGVLQGYSYGDTTYPRTTPNILDLLLKIEPTESSELKVRVRKGIVQSSGASITVVDQKSNIFTAPSSNSKIFLVYVDRLTGNILIDSSGTEAASPTAPNYAGKMVLAEVTIASTDTNITAAMIQDVREFLANKIGFVIENRTNDPSSPATGQIWLRTDL